MSKHRIWLLGALALLISVAVSIPTLAGAKPAGPKNHAVNTTTLLDAVTSTGAQGVAGTKEQDAGIVSGTIGGKPVSGASVQKTTWGPGLTFTSKGTTFDAKGTTSYTASGKFTVSGTTETATGTATVTGGTGAYKGAKGKLTLTGNGPLGSDTDAATVHAIGNVKY
jgi:hypothetical protein